MQGLKEDLKANPPCHPRAVSHFDYPHSPAHMWHMTDNVLLTVKLIRAWETDCLAKNGYNEDKCQPVITALYECCEAFYRSKGEGAISASCPKPHLLQFKLARLRETSQSKR
ncbi:unnamed protein product [Colletotrichum noveboracense]|uniref:Cx9C motif-containing protein 4, mitochondrial n=1 Tax=Colletotrichum noveboracense TaxID=2664923 RepID=A0A9W4WDX8_9PEZI|nr:unnamed protein product [Colletotrichum noveboracense]